MNSLRHAMCLCFVYHKRMRKQQQNGSDYPLYDGKLGRGSGQEGLPTIQRH